MHCQRMTQFYLPPMHLYMVSKQLAQDHYAALAVLDHLASLVGCLHTVDS